MASSLNHILNMGGESLHNSRLGVDVTSHNITNAQTPGFSRQSVNVKSKEPVQYGLHSLGNGAEARDISRVHDSFLEKQLRQETQNQASCEEKFTYLSKLENLFNPELTSTIRDKMNLFTNSLRNLSNYPTEMSVRINVAETGQALTQSFNETLENVKEIQNTATEEAKANVIRLNQLFSEVAKLNESIVVLSAGSESPPNDLLDKRDLAIKEIATLIDIKVIRDNNNQLMIRGPGEKALVEGHLYAILAVDDVSSNDKKLPPLLVSNFERTSWTDITEKTSGGKLGGSLFVRDNNAQKIRDEVNDLARMFAVEFNKIHEKGFGIGMYGNEPGRAFFSGLEKSGDVASNIAVELLILNDPAAISSGMTTNNPGDNVIANEMIKFFYNNYYDGGKSNIGDVYDQIIGRLGIDALKSKEEAKAADIILTQLKGQRESIAGVSMDEEASNLMKYQHLFTASSKIITTVDDMFKTILDLKR